MEQTPTPEPNNSAKWLERMLQAFYAEFMPSQEFQPLNVVDKSHLVSEDDNLNWATAKSFYALILTKSERLKETLSPETKAFLAEYEAEVLGIEPGEQ